MGGEATKVKSELYVKVAQLKFLPDTVILAEVVDGLMLATVHV